MAMYDPDFFMEWCDDDEEIEEVENSSVICTWAPHLDYVIDSIKNEKGSYETAIRIEDGEIDLTGNKAFAFTEWIVVEFYNTYDECVKGHEFWTNLCQEFAPRLFRDVMLDEFIYIQMKKGGNNNV